MHKITVHGRMPTLNSWRNTHYHKKNKEKKQWQNDIIWACKESKLTKPYPTPLALHITQHTARKRDVDNIVIAAKYFLDALQQGGYIEDDGPEYVPFMSMNWKKANGYDNEKCVFTLMTPTQYEHVCCQFLP